jgi:molybdate transport system ATP-binding protein
MATESGVPIILVSHSADEVQRLADHVAFMRNGRIERVDTLHEALACPDSPLFEDAGAASVLEGQLGEASEDGMRLFGPQTAQLWVPDRFSDTAPKSIRLRILARDVSLSLENPHRISIQNHLPVAIERIDPPQNHRVVIACRTADQQLLLAEVTPRAVTQLELEVGLRLYALIKSVALLS